MEKAILVSAAYGWFAGLLVIMILVCALFGLIMFIALRPIKSDELEDSTAAKLKRREAELTRQLISNQKDQKTTEQLISQLREVQSAEKLVSELSPEEEKPAPNKAKKPAAHTAKKAAPKKPAAKPAANVSAKPVENAAANTAEQKEVKPEEKGQK